MGGFATPTRGNPGDALTQLLSDTEKGRKLLLQGPSKRERIEWLQFAPCEFERGWVTDGSHGNDRTL